MRAGSKSVPNKNILPFGGKPLLAHTIEHAQQSGMFDGANDSICVTSDSDTYLELAGQYGVSDLIKRPDELASDKAAKIPVLRHAVAEIEARKNCEYDCVIELQVTSPLRLPSDIAAAIHIYDAGNDLQNLASVTPTHASPYFTVLERSKSGQISLSKSADPPVERRQDAPECYELNGSIYVWDRKFLETAERVTNERTEIYVMPDYRSLDIDVPLDFALAEYVFKNVDLKTGQLLEP